MLYPPGLPARDRLARYAAEFDTVELNASFYRWPPASRFQGWQSRLPAGFAMSVKAARGLTHGRKLYAPEEWVTRMSQGWHELGDKRAVLIAQLPPSMPRDDDRLAYFLDRIPEWMPTAVELRHPSWDVEPVFELLARHRAAYCVMSGAGLPCRLRVTSEVAYVRLHGPSHDHLYGGSYSDADMAWWADRLVGWRDSGHRVFAYFNNDGDGNAVRNARTLKEFVRARD